VDYDNLRIETERLILRPPRVEDFDAYAANMADEEAARYIGGLQARPVAWRGMLQLAGAWSIQGFSMFSVIEKASDQWIGRLGPWYPEGWPGPEVGWALARAAWGKGYAHEGCVAAIDWTFAHLDWTRMGHCIHPDNHASKALARRLGSHNQGPCEMPPPFAGEPCELWGQTREQWLQHRVSMEK
jgi:RimJ/RimL family protein N-acetyltransferase